MRFGHRSHGFRFFPDTSLIYGLELTALVLTATDPRIPLGNSRTKCYVGENNTIVALINSDFCREVIADLARLFLAICAARCIAPWLERVGGDVNISDIHTRGADLPFGTELVSDFPCGSQLLKMATCGIMAHAKGYFDPEVLVGIFHPMFRHGRDRIAHDALLRATARTTDFSDLVESGMISRLETSHPTYPDGDFPREFLSGILRNRISRHAQIGLLPSTPTHQPIDAETATHFWGYANLLLLRMRPLFR